MTATVELPPAPPAQPLRWRRAFGALRALLDDPDDTAQAGDLVMAIGTRSNERNFRRFAASPLGRALLAQRPSLADALSDRAALERLPASSLGRAYLAYLDRNGFRPLALVEMGREIQARWQREEATPPLDPVRSWINDRITLAHDLFHVLTDYGTDGVGEATLLAFSLAQLGGRANALLTVGAAFEVWRILGASWLRYEFRAWRRGRRAMWLAALPWEDLLPLRLETVRALVGVESPERAHPGGILRGNFDERGVLVPA
jgi:ubiquinone biosynthesis protein COQ4